MTDPRVISLDIETYGACLQDWDGNSLPEQRYFQPLRSLLTDGVTQGTLVLTVSLTIPEYDPRWSQESSSQPQPYGLTWNASSIGALKPGPSMVFKMWKEEDRNRLIRWLRWADTIVGMNLLFDLSYLRQLADIKLVLDGTHTLIDLSYVNYLENEMRPERSLKTVGPVLRLYSYDEEATLKKGHRFPDPNDHKFILYNAQDSHNTILAVAELARRIVSSFGEPLWIGPPLSPLSQTSTARPPSSISSLPSSPTGSSASSLNLGLSPETTTATVKDGSNSRSTTPLPQTKSLTKLSGSSSVSPLLSRVDNHLPPNRTGKLTEFTVRFFSDSIWACIRMSENGVPMDRSRLEHLERQYTLKAQVAASVAASKYNLVLEGEGSAKSKVALLKNAVAEVDGLAIANFWKEWEAYNGPSPEPGSQERYAILMDFGPSSILDHPLMELTEKTQELSVKDQNRKLLLQYLPSDSPTREALWLWDVHATAQKRISSFLFPLLYHRRTKNLDQSSILLCPTSLHKKLSRPASLSLAPLSSSSSSTASSDSGTGSSAPRYRKRSPAQFRRRRKEKMLRRERSPRGLKARIKFSQKPEIPTVHRYEKEGLAPRLALTRQKPPSVCTTHPSWHIVPSFAKDDSGDDGGQKQARLSCKNPAAQTWPKDIKTALKSRWEHGVIATFDLSQAELRVAALLSGDTGLIRAFKENLDLHSDRAIEVFTMETLSAKYPVHILEAWRNDKEKKHPLREDFDDHYRQPAKHANFSDLNLASAKALQRVILVKSGLLVSMELCELIVNSRERVRPGLYHWQRELIARAKAEGRLELPFTGISRWFLGGEGNLDSEIVNLPIQAGAATAMREVGHYLDKTIVSPLNSSRKSILPALNVYDAGYYDCRTLEDAKRLEVAVAEAVRWLNTEGFWGWMQELYGTEVELKYDFKLIK